MAAISPSSTIIVTADGHVKQRELDKALAAALAETKFADLNEIQDRLVRFDFTEAAWFDLSCLLWLITVFSRLRRQANVIELQLPRRPANEDSIRRAPTNSRAAMRGAENLWSALLRWDFFDVLARCVDDPLNLLPPELHSALLRPSRYSRGERPEEATDSDFAESAPAGYKSGRLLELSLIEIGAGYEASIDKTVADYNSTLVRNNLRYHMRWSETEIDDFTTIAVPHAVGNVSHARGSFAIVASRADDKFLHFCVTDNGIGIPNLLREAMRDQALAGTRDSALIEYFAGAELLDDSLRSLADMPYEDSEFVVASTAAGVGSDTSRRGFGLFYLKQLVLDKGGEFRIRSGKAMVTFDGRKSRRRKPSGEALRVDGLIDSPGTSMRVMLPREVEADERR
jgi:hypothetical protein